MPDNREPASFLAGLDDEARALLLSVARPVAFAAGATLVRHGEAARGAWVLREGEVEAVVTLPGGESLTVARLGAGAMFGETALVETGTCSATVRAASGVDGWFVAHEDFRALVSQCQPAAIRLQHAVTLVLAHKLGALNAQLLACPAPEDRPARVLAPGGDDPLQKVPRPRRPSFEVAAFLPRLPFFERFGADEIDALVALGAYVEPPRGHGIFSAGAVPRAAFLVARGAVEVVAMRAGRERRVALLGPGQLVGYVSALRESPHSTHGFARETSVLLEIPAAAFRAAYFGDARMSARLRQGVQASLLASIARTNRALTRLISQARLDASHATEKTLEAAYHGQLTV